MRLVFAVLLLSCTCVSAQTLPAANNTFDTVVTQRIIQRTYATSGLSQRDRYYGCVWKGLSTST